jgi:hypothetical protein
MTGYDFHPQNVKVEKKVHNGLLEWWSDGVMEQGNDVRHSDPLPPNTPSLHHSTTPFCPREASTF